MEQLEDRWMLAVITVTSSADDLVVDGMVTLREAIQAANTDMSVDGSVAGSGADTISFDGALSGQTITLGGTELAITEALTIDATTLANNVTIDANLQSRIFNITATSGDFTLAGLTLTGGRTTGDNANGSDTTFSGGAIRSLTTGNLTIDQSTVSGNYTRGHDAGGGGIFSKGALTLTSSTVSGNSTAGDYADGGGIFSSGDVTLTNSTVSGNSTAGTFALGGGIQSGGAVTLTNSTVSGNSTVESDAHGGGVFSYGAITLTNSTVSGNFTTGSGAVGGGISSLGDVTLTSSTVTNNHAFDSTATGGGVWNFHDTFTITITNSIVAGNTANGGSPDINLGTGSFDVNYSLLGTAVTPDPGGIGNLQNDTPLLGVLGDNGGPTETHALLAGSLAIDAGDPGIVFNPAEFDQRGTPFVRVFDDPGAAGTGVDIGAYELQTVLPSFFVVTTTDDELDYSNANVSLREAVNSANGSIGADTILFDAALSGAAITLGGTELAITEALTIDATALANHVTIDANLLSRIFNITATSGDFTLAGLTLTGGRTTGDNPFLFDTTFNGGAIRSLTTGNLTIDQSTVSGNYTTGFIAHGGGIFSQGTVTLTSSTVSGNSTAGSNARGGGIYSRGAVTLTSSTVSGNSTAGDFAFGGGIISYDAVTLTSSTVSGNSTEESNARGGGIYSRGAVTLTSSTVSGNSTAGSNARGGGIYSDGAVTLTSTTVSGNSTAGYLARGGGIYSRGAVTLTGSTVSGNSTAGSNAGGGGIYSYGAVTLTSSTVSGNSTAGYNANGGGIRSSDAVTLTSSTVSGNSTAGNGARGGGILSLGDVTLTSSTVTDNHANYANATGGGVWNNNDTITITNSIVAGNTAGGGSPDLAPGIGTLTVDYSLIGDNAGTGLVEAQTPDANGNLIGSAAGSGIIDPLLGALGDNGGPTETHALLLGSLAIDAGDPGIVFNPTEFDQRGSPFVRVANGIDIGAYEFLGTFPAQGLIVDTAVDIFDNNSTIGNLSLREAVFWANIDPLANTITFDASLSGQTITLGGTELSITEALTIDATALANHVTIDANLLSRIFNITAASGDFTLAGLTLTGGRTTGDNANSSVTTFSGGAIRSLTTGNLTIDQSTVSGNYTTGFIARGGGIFSSGAVTLTSSTVSGNSTAGGLARGGGIFSSGAVTLTSSTVSGNYTTGSSAGGGGIRSSGAVTLTGSTVIGNSTAGTFALGGGIYSSGAVTLTSSTISGNSTAGGAAGGGGIYSYGAVTLTSSTVSGNSTTGNSAVGGGVFSYGAVTLTSSTVSGNSTAGNGARGGGIISNGDVTLTNSTVTDNHANYANATAGGVWNNDDTITITNSIVAGNTAGGGSPDINPGTGIFDVNYSLLGTAVTPDPGGIGNLQNDTPLLGALGDNGGPTETHALLVGSLAINAGDPDFATPPDFDQRGAGFARVKFDRVDIGAFELQVVSMVIPGGGLEVDTIADEFDGDYGADDLSLREAIFLANANAGDDTITFAASLSGQTITLGGTELSITEALTIDATALANNVTIDANLLSRIVNITATSGDFTLAGLTLTSGSSFGRGGAIRSLTTGNLTLDQSTVSGNSSTTEDSGAGGGIYSFGAVTLTSSTVSGNSTAGNSSGGGISTRVGAVTLTNSTVSGNSTAGDGAAGGGIQSGGAVTLTNSTVSGNSTAGSYARGGGINSRGAVTLTNSTLSGNSTAGYFSHGGGIHSGGAVTLTNSTVSGNSTAGDFAHGGGIYSYGAVTLTSSTVSGNSTAGAGGGGIYSGGPDTITITNSIVAGNTAGGGNPDLAPGIGTLTVDYSLIGDNAGTALVEAQTPDANGNLIGSAAGSGIIDPLLGSLTNNGGPTETHALLVGSPAIDAGDPGVVSPPNYDQRGFAFERIVNSRIDMGAFESGATSADFDLSGIIDGLDFLAWQRGFGSSPVVHADGDANVDGAVDSVDLSIWESTYALVEPPPLAAALDTGQLATAVEPAITVAQAPPVEVSTTVVQFTLLPSAAELTDAAMAFGLASDATVKEEPPVDDHSTSTAATYDSVHATGHVTPIAPATNQIEPLANSSTEVEAADQPWLTEELLERVFG